MESQTRRYGAAFAAAVVWFGSQRVVGGHSYLGQGISNAGLVAVALLSGLACAVRAHRLPQGRRAWVLIGLSAASWGLGQLVWTVYETGLGREIPFPSYADLGYLASVPLLVAGLLSLPGSPQRLAGRLRLLLDGCIVATALFMVSWELVLAATLKAGGDTPLATVISLSYPVGDVISGTVALVVLSRARHGSRVPVSALLLLVAGSMSSAVADSGFAYLTLHGTYYSGHPIDLFWFTGYLAVGLAASTPDRSGPQEQEHAASALSATAPYVAVVAALAVDIVRQVGHGQLGFFMTWATMALVALLSLRQVLALRENAQLTRSLEQRVLDRTNTLAAQEAWFRTLVQNLSDVVTVVDPDGIVTYQTPSAETHFGRRPSQAVGIPLVSWFSPYDGVRLSVLFDELARSPGSTRMFSGDVLHADGDVRSVEASVTSFAASAHLSGFVVNARDVSERRRLERELSHQAFHDALTGLANRALFRDRVEHALASRGRSAEPLAVLFLDLDGFKGVNDSLGHSAGDLLLEQVADRLLAAVRPSDTVARFGGDEFAVLLETIDGGHDAVDVAHRIGEQLREPLLIGDREVSIGASCGIAMYDGHASADDLLRNADLAMYRAKSRGGSTFDVFEPGMHAALVERLELENDLRQALRRGELRVAYQPTVLLHDTSWVGSEALLRWDHPTRGLVGPTDFISVAEDIGAIVEIGAWVLNEACRQTAVWRRDLPELSAFTIAVNVSPVQLLDPGFLATVDDALSTSGLPASALVVEITENILIERTEEMLGLLVALKSRGVRLAIDDFGTGYSSLSYLSRFPVDILKIDRSFVSQVNQGTDERELTRTIVRLGQSLSLTLVAEGIEQADQLDSLRVMSCQLGQGFLFSRPVRPEEIEAAVLAGRPVDASLLPLR